MSAVALDAIQVGERHRADLGDVDALAKSIAEVGLLHPLVVDKDLRLLAGQRRLEALRRLGWTETPVTVAESVTDEDLALQAEQEENTCRKDFTPGEAHAVWAERKARLEGEAKAAMSEGGKKGKPGQASKGTPEERTFDDEPKKKRLYESRDRAAKGTGYSATSMERVQAVKNAVNDPDPTIAARAVVLSERLDEGTVTPVAALRELDEVLKGTTSGKVASKLPVAKRIEQITERAKQGMSVQQIATQIGMTYGAVLNIVNRHGIDVPARVGARSTRTIDPDRVVTELVNTLEAAVTSTGLIDIAAITVDRVEAAQAIDAALASLRKFLKQLKEEDQ